MPGLLLLTIRKTSYFEVLISVLCRDIKGFARINWENFEGDESFAQDDQYSNIHGLYPIFHWNSLRIYSRKA